MWKNYTTIIWGAYQYFNEKIDLLMPKIQVDFVYPGEFETTVNLRNIPKIEKSKIKSEKNPFVIISFAKAIDIQNAAKYCKENKIPYSLIDWMITGLIDGRQIQLLGGGYTDENLNQIEVSKEAYGKIIFDVNEAKYAKIKVGKIHVKERMRIRLFGIHPEFTIGDNSTVVLMFAGVNSNGKIIIGNDCMISHHVDLQQSDQHMIFDLYSKKRINYSKNIVIGNHVWLGRECQILGGANIGDNSVVGSRCVTSSKFPQNVIIAGVPGTVIRKDIIWARDMMKHFEYDDFNDCQDKAALKYLNDN